MTGWWTTGAYTTSASAIVTSLPPSRRLHTVGNFARLYTDVIQQWSCAAVRQCIVTPFTQVQQKSTVRQTQSAGQHRPVKLCDATGGALISGFKDLESAMGLRPAIRMTTYKRVGDVICVLHYVTAMTSYKCLTSSLT